MRKRPLLYWTPMLRAPVGDGKAMRVPRRIRLRRRTRPETSP